MLYYLKLYLITLAAFFAIDMVWLGVIARSFYARHLGFLLAPSTNWIAALIFYLLFIVGILFFVVVPGLEKGSFGAMLVRAALFGLITYATYDLTNLATVKGWPLIVTAVDMIWGMVLSTSVAAVSYAAGKWLAG